MKFKIYLEYAGANYSGWQKQPKETSVKTVQGTLIKAINTVFSKNKGINRIVDLRARAAQMREFTPLNWLLALSVKLCWLLKFSK